MSALSNWKFAKKKSDTSTKPDIFRVLAVHEHGPTAQDISVVIAKPNREPEVVPFLSVVLGVKREHLIEQYPNELLEGFVQFHYGDWHALYRDGVHLYDGHDQLEGEMWEVFFPLLTNQHNITFNDVDGDKEWLLRYQADARANNTRFRMPEDIRDVPVVRIW
jgi:hypothetical protein